MPVFGLIQKNTIKPLRDVYFSFKTQHTAGLCTLVGSHKELTLKKCKKNLFFLLFHEDLHYSCFILFYLFVFLAKMSEKVWKRCKHGISRTEGWVNFKVVLLVVHCV